MECFLQSYVRALFGYDPTKDSLLPCPEIGLPFKYGDVLQVKPFYYELNGNFSSSPMAFLGEPTMPQSSNVCCTHLRFSHLSLAGGEWVRSQLVASKA